MCVCVCVCVCVVLSPTYLSSGETHAFLVLCRKFMASRCQPLGLALHSVGINPTLLKAALNLQLSSKRQTSSGGSVVTYT